MSNAKKIFQAKTRKPYTKKKPRTREDIAKDRLTFSVIRYLSGKSPRQAVAGTEQDNQDQRPIAEGTVRNLRRPIKDGGTRYPRASTLTRLLEAHGASLEVVKDGKVWK